MRVFGPLAAAAVVISSALAAQAATVKVFDPTDYPAVTAGWSNAVGEDFEALGSAGGRREVASLATSVGTFTTLGGKGTGATVTDKLNNTSPKNTGRQLALRSGSVYGRSNVGPSGGRWFLDTNDTYGLSWAVGLAGHQAFSRLIFAVSDATDEGAFLRLIVDGVVQTVFSGLKNGVTKLVMIDFGGPVRSAKIELADYTKAVGGKLKTNDGFSIDAIQVAPVPLPAGALLLGSALAGVGALRRRRTAA